MFRASSRPSSGDTRTAVAASGLPSELGDSSAVARGRAGRPDHEQQVGGPQDRSGWLQKILPPPGFDPPTDQPVASR